MNTTKKGDKLESKIFKLIKQEVVQGNFLGTPSNCRIFSKKGYYSKERGKNIVFDIAVEIYLPGQTNYSILVLIECKNYNHPVPVNDVEEFYQKIEQVAGANRKGIIASTNSFQEGAINYSKSKGIGLLRYYNNKKIKWELTRSPSALVSFSFAESEWRNAYRGLTIDSYESQYFDCYCYSGDEYTNSLRAFFLRLLFAGSDEELKKQLERITARAVDNRRLVEYIEPSQIDKVVRGILESVGYNSGAVPLNLICEAHAAKNRLKVIFETANACITKNGAILGKIRFHPLEIRIYRSLEQNKERERFTLAHELGHYLLNHSRYMTGEYTEEADIKVESPIELGVKDIMSMEWQANQFASCLLLPTKQFVTDFFTVAESFSVKDRGYGALYLDEQRCNIENYYKITDVLKSKYQVSREVLRIRLKKLRLLNEKAGLQRLPLNDIFERY